MREEWELVKMEWEKSENLSVLTKRREIVSEKRGRETDWESRVRNEAKKMRQKVGGQVEDRRLSETKYENKVTSLIEKGISTYCT